MYPRITILGVRILSVVNHRIIPDDIRRQDARRGIRVRFHAEAVGEVRAIHAQDNAIFARGHGSTRAETAASLTAACLSTRARAAASLTAATLTATLPGSSGTAATALAAALSARSNAASTRPACASKIPGD